MKNRFSLDYPDDTVLDLREQSGWSCSTQMIFDVSKCIREALSVKDPLIQDQKTAVNLVNRE